MADEQGYTIEAQIACVKREIAMRKNVYPKWVAGGRMKQEAADREIAAMKAVLTTLAASKGWRKPRPDEQFRALDRIVYSLRPSPSRIALCSGPGKPIDAVLDLLPFEAPGDDR